MGHTACAERALICIATCGFKRPPGGIDGEADLQPDKGAIKRRTCPGGRRGDRARRLRTRRGPAAPGGGRRRLCRWRPGRPTPPTSPPSRGRPARRQAASNVAYDVQVIAKGLENPWALAFLPDGRMLVTEQPGRLRVVAKDGTLSAPVTGLPAVDANGQGGLLDVVLGPSYAERRDDLLELRRAAARTATARRSRADGSCSTRARRGSRTPRSFSACSPTSRRTCTTARAWCSRRDGKLFVTLGERSKLEGRVQAQDLKSHFGKIVRINADGSVPQDNPFVGQAGRQAGDLGEGRAQRPGRGPGSAGPALGGRARPARRRRAEPGREGQGLRLAHHQLRHRVPRPPDRRGDHPGGRAWSSRSTTGTR